jgi:hypothetical protein
MFRRCVSTVLGLRKRISAISGFVLRQQSEEFARLTEEARAALAEVMPSLLAM